jgi:hypothetical protein
MTGHSLTSGQEALERVRAFDLGSQNAQKADSGFESAF